MKKIALLIMTVVMAAFVAAMPNVAFAALNQRGDEACANYTGPDKDLICPPSPGGSEPAVMNTVGNVLNAIYGVVGILTVVMIVIGGVKYMTSQGDPGKLSSAKNTIMYSVIGLIITLSAFAITAFVLSAF